MILATGAAMAQKQLTFGPKVGMDLTNFWGKDLRHDIKAHQGWTWWAFFVLGDSQDCLVSAIVNATRTNAMNNMAMMNLTQLKILMIRSAFFLFI